ncbi:hypothetical protein DFH06DRAFT_1057448 [Mycena polygramma]|nr:hypothetical protein DFH06DRAFT_1057448 [Mycena polygramma]
MACWNCGAPPTADRELSILPSINIDHLLSTNDPPSHVEAPLIREFLANCPLQIDGLNTHIDVLSKTLARLVAERDGLADRLQKYPDVLAPVRRLPSEVVCEIFSWTLPYTRKVRTNEYTWTKRVPHPPLYLGHISRIWKDIAIGFPSLWSTIIVHPSKNPDLAVAMIQTQLTRTASAPLRIILEWWTADTNAALPLLDLLLRHSNRWTFLRVVCYDCSYPALLDLLHRAKGQLAHLKTLEIELDDEIPDGVDEYDVKSLDDLVASDIFLSAPRLREVFLTDPTFAQGTPPLLLPWDRITSYRGYDPAHRFVNVVRSASNLVEGALTTYGGIIDHGLQITFPFLRRLHIDSVEFGDDVFFQKFAAPALEYLSCCEIEFVHPFVQNSACQLTTLVLTKSPCSCEFMPPPDDLIALLKNLPSLRRLLLQARGYNQPNEGNDEVLGAMTLSGSADDVCPNLVHFGYAFESYRFTTGEPPFSINLLMTMLRSRLHPTSGHPLSSLTFSPPLRDKGISMDQVRTLGDEGLDVRWIKDRRDFLHKARTSFAF